MLEKTKKHKCKDCRYYKHECKVEVPEHIPLEQREKYTKSYYEKNNTHEACELFNPDVYYWVNCSEDNKPNIYHHPEDIPEPGIYRPGLWDH